MRSAAAVTAAGERRRAAGRAWTVLGESSSAGDLVRRWMLLWEMGWPAAVASSATRRSLSFWVSMASRIRSPRRRRDEVSFFDFVTRSRPSALASPRRRSRLVGAVRWDGDDATFASNAE